MTKSLLKHNLNVLLISTNFCRKDESRTPYGVSCLMSAFRTSEKNHGVIRNLNIDLGRFYDNKGGIFKINHASLAKRLVQSILKSGCNVVAFSTFAWSDKLFSMVISRLAMCENRPLIVVGGPMVIGSLDSLCIRYKGADYFIESYGEKVFSNLAFYLGGEARLIKDLPEFETLASPYLTGEISVQVGQSVRMELRRGCLFHCAFCRHRNLEKKVFCVGCRKNHVEELEFFKKKKVRKINVLDPFFNDRRKDFKELSMNFLSDLQKMRIESEVSLQIRPEMLDEDYLNEAEKVPNVIFEIGVQSLDNEVCKAIERGGNNDRVLEKLAEVARRKIRTEITLIYGLPKQTAKSFRHDLETLRKFNFSKISAFPFQIYHGTKLYETYKEFGLKGKENSLGILQVYDNPTHDFAEMEKIGAEFVALE